MPSSVGVVNRISLRVVSERVIAKARVNCLCFFFVQDKERASAFYVCSRSCKVKSESGWYITTAATTYVAVILPRILRTPAEVIRFNSSADVLRPTLC